VARPRRALEECCTLVVKPTAPLKKPPQAKAVFIVFWQKKQRHPSNDRTRDENLI
jgi:hypothetical protein